MIKGELSTGLFVNAASVIMRLGVATTILVGASLILSGQIDFMLLFLFLLVITRIYAPFDQSLALIAEMFVSQVSADRMNEIYDTPAAEGSEAFKPNGHDIVFDHVGFAYDKKDVLQDVSFTAREGEITALVGPSGGGKTTLCNLIPRFYDVTGGRILIDGQDIQHITLKSLREDIGIVQQDVYLFSGSVADNIAYGKPGATREEIIEAARLAGAERFILALKNGFDTYVGERGVKLSGGQKQRIAIARVFLKNPPILILDEATSALDNESEILVGQSLEKLAHGRTTLTIAHRLTTIKNYDRILVLGSDGIEESGTHDELLAQHGVYYRLWNQLPGKDTL